MQEGQCVPRTRCLEKIPATWKSQRRFKSTTSFPIDHPPDDRTNRGLYMNIFNPFNIACISSMPLARRLEMLPFAGLLGQLAVQIERATTNPRALTDTWFIDPERVAGRPMTKRNPGQPQAQAGVPASVSAMRSHTGRRVSRNPPPPADGLAGGLIAQTVGSNGCRRTCA